VVMSTSSKKGGFFAKERCFSLDLSREIPKDSEAYFTGTRPLMGAPLLPMKAHQNSKMSPPCISSNAKKGHISR
jgi:hypothetical protein